MVSCSTDQGDCISNGHDKRAASRARIQALPVKVTGECARFYGYSRDISTSGMQVRAFSHCPDWPKTVGDKIRIEFEMPDNSIEICCKGEIVWNDVPKHRSESFVLQGIKFVDLTPEAQERISLCLKGLRA